MRPKTQAIHEVETNSPSLRLSCNPADVTDPSFSEMRPAARTNYSNASSRMLPTLILVLKSLQSSRKGSIPLPYNPRFQTYSPFRSHHSTYLFTIWVLRRKMPGSRRNHSCSRQLSRNEQQVSHNAVGNVSIGQDQPPGDIQMRLSERITFVHGT